MDGPLTIVEASTTIRAGTLTPSGLLEQCLARIDVYEPAVKAWAYLDRDRARTEAKSLDAAANRGPLHGIPVGIKDIIDVFDMPTGCGSKLWASSYSRKDAEVVSRLRQAGALILGKTVATPYAFLDPPPTRNPWDLSRTPGGSSSGSAAAIACGMCLAALGTQTGGSTIRPASFCGVTGFKPTWGSLSVEGVLPLAPSLDHIGLMAQTAQDVGILYQAIRKKRSESFIPQIILHPLADYEPSPLEPEMIHAMEAYYSAMNHRYPMHPIQIPFSHAAVTAAQFLIFSYEAAHYHGSRLHRHPEDYPPRITNFIASGRNVKRNYYQDARKRMKATRASMMAAFPADASLMVLPATGGQAPDCSTTGDPAWQSAWSFAGVPAVSLPLSGDGMPLSVQIIAKPGDDVRLLFAATQMEQAISRSIRLPTP